MKFIESDKIKVFPSAYRNTDKDVKAKLFSEDNITAISYNLLDKDGVVLTPKQPLILEGHSLSFILHGYLFTIDNFLAEISDITNTDKIYAYIELDTASNDTLSITRLANLSQAGGGNADNLDIEIDGRYFFGGLKIGGVEDPSKYDHILPLAERGSDNKWYIPHTSRLKLDGSSIMSTDADTSIDNLIITNKITGRNNTDNYIDIADEVLIHSADNITIASSNTRSLDSAFKITCDQDHVKIGHEDKPFISLEPGFLDIVGDEVSISAPNNVSISSPNQVTIGEANDGSISVGQGHIGVNGEDIEVNVAEISMSGTQDVSISSTDRMSLATQDAYISFEQGDIDIDGHGISLSGEYVYLGDGNEISCSQGYVKLDTKRDGSITLQDSSITVDGDNIDLIASDRIRIGNPSTYGPNNITVADRDVSIVGNSDVTINAGNAASALPAIGVSDSGTTKNIILKTDNDCSIAMESTWASTPSHDITLKANTTTINSDLEVTGDNINLKADSTVIDGDVEITGELKASSFAGNIWTTDNLSFTFDSDTGVLIITTSN